MVPAVSTRAATGATTRAATTDDLLTRYYDATLARLVADWARRDFDLFGYSRQLPGLPTSPSTTRPSPPVVPSAPFDRSPPSAAMLAALRPSASSSPPTRRSTPTPSLPPPSLPPPSRPSPSRPSPFSPPPAQPHLGLPLSLLTFGGWTLALAVCWAAWKRSRFLGRPRRARSYATLTRVIAATPQACTLQLTDRSQTGV